jgi:hypothetical protein
MHEQLLFSANYSTYNQYRKFTNEKPEIRDAKTYVFINCHDGVGE